MATKLERIRLSEISGVDSPANMVDGWLIMKNRGPSPLRKAGDPVRLTNGRIVGRVVGFNGDRVTVDWVTDEVRELAKNARIEAWEDGIYLVGDDGSLGIGKALLAGHRVVIS